MLLYGKSRKSSLFLTLIAFSCIELSHSFQQYGSIITRTVPFNNNAQSQVPMGISQYNSKRTKLHVKGAVAGVNDHPSEKKKDSFLKIIWRFTRPHTIIGSAMAIPALHVLAAPTFKDAFTMTCAVSVIYATVPALLMNLYITGLNQITDVEIDKVNKPNLPIAAGDLSMQTATIVVIASVIASVALGVAHPILGTQGLNIALWGSMILGTLYSLQPFRLKRFPLLAAFCVVSVRGAVINAGFYAHAKAAAFSGSGVGTTVLGCLSEPRCLLSSLFFAVFGVVIGKNICFSQHYYCLCEEDLKLYPSLHKMKALMKDVPDAVGDAMYNIRSFTVRIGQKTVFTAMRRLLSTLFVGVGLGFLKGAIDASTTTITACRTIVTLSSFAAALSVRKEAQTVNAEDSGMVYEYYMHLWKLFYLSYLVLPFAR